MAAIADLLRPRAQLVPDADRLGDTQGVQQQLHFVDMPVQTSKNGNIVTGPQRLSATGSRTLPRTTTTGLLRPSGYGYWLDYLITEVMPRAD